MHGRDLYQRLDLLPVNGARRFAQMRRCFLAADFALPELLHHCRMFIGFGLIQMLPIVSQELVGRLKGCTLVPINKSVVAGNPSGVRSPVGKFNKSVAMIFRLLADFALSFICRALWHIRQAALSRGLSFQDPERNGVSGRPKRN